MEIIEDGFNGLVVPIKDDTALADSIRKLQQTPELLQKFKDNSKSKLQNELSHNLTVRKYIDYFQSLIN